MKEQIKKAALLLKDGQLVAFPTETVYGLGADATNDTAVASIYEKKGRPSFNPLIACRWNRNGKTICSNHTCCKKAD